MSCLKIDIYDLKVISTDAPPGKPGEPSASPAAFARRGEIYTVKKDFSTLNTKTRSIRAFILSPLQARNCILLNDIQIIQKPLQQ